MGKSVFSRIFVIFAFFALFACDQVFAGGGMFGRGPDGDSGGASNGGRPGNNSGNNQRCQANQYKDYLNSNGSCHDCPTPYPKSASGTTDITGCYNDDSGQKVYWSSSGITLSCTIGWYVPANSHTCAPCQSGHLCPGGNFYGDVTYNQRSRLCLSVQSVPNVDHTECLSKAELFCDLNKYRDTSGNCQPCPTNFPKADGRAISKTHCYKDLSDRRVYYNESDGGDRLCEDGKYKDSQHGCIKCQAGFSHSDSDATKASQCWDYDTKNRKMYYGYIDGTGTESNPKVCDSTADCTKCPDNTYVKAKTNWCSACPSGKVCMGGWYFPHMNADLGISDKDSHGCRVGGTGSIQNAQYWENNTCKDCPNDFFLADPNATSRDQCYKQIGNNKKLYYKKVSCGAGQYLPKASSECKSCLDGYYCTADTYYPNLKDDQGLKNCPSGQVPNSNKTACVTDSGGDNGGNGDNSGGTGGGTEKCNPGQYLPKNKGRCSPCPSQSKYCPGGRYQYPKSEDQGIYDCPQNGFAKSDNSGCFFKLTQKLLKNGPDGSKTKFGNQCWTKTNTVAYAKCLFPNGIDSVANPGLVIDDKVEDTAPATEPVAMD